LLQEPQISQLSRSTLLRLEAVVQELQGTISDFARKYRDEPQHDKKKITRQGNEREP